MKKTDLFSIRLSEQQLEELHAILEFAGLTAVDMGVAGVNKLSEEQLNALKRLASSSANLIQAIGSSLLSEIENATANDTSTLH